MEQRETPRTDIRMGDSLLLRETIHTIAGRIQKHIEIVPPITMDLFAELRTHFNTHEPAYLESVSFGMLSVLLVACLDSLDEGDVTKAIDSLHYGVFRAQNRPFLGAMTLRKKSTHPEVSRKEKFSSPELRRKRDSQTKPRLVSTIRKRHV